MLWLLRACLQTPESGFEMVIMSQDRFYQMAIPCSFIQPHISMDANPHHLRPRSMHCLTILTSNAWSSEEFDYLRQLLNVRRLNMHMACMHMHNAPAPMISYSSANVDH